MAKSRSAVVVRAPRTLAAVLLVALLLGAALAALPRPAVAVTPVASNPQVHQRLDQQPGSVTLAFAREVDPSVAKIIVTGPDGKNATSGTLIVEGTNVTTLLQDDLDRGTYTVHFRIDGKNGDPEGGAYQFSYGSGSFTDLPDKSWSGEDEEPAVLRGTNPNGSEQPDPPSDAQTPGIEVTSQAASSDPNPPPSDPPSTVDPPPGPATSEAAGAPDTSEPASTSASSASPDASDDGSSGTPWVVGGVLLLLAVGGTAFGLWHSNKEKSAGSHD